MPRKRAHWHKPLPIGAHVTRWEGVDLDPPAQTYAEAEERAQAYRDGVKAAEAAFNPLLPGGRRVQGESMNERIELGCPGHLIVASRCRWHRHTQVGLFRISSIGNYFPDRDGKRETIGAGDDAFFETLVLKTTGKPDTGNEECGCFEVADWGEIDGERYATAGEAQAGHERYVAKYLTESHAEGSGK